MSGLRGVAGVRGGGSGRGREIALELARRGYDLALLGRRRQTLEETLELAGARQSGAHSGAVFPFGGGDAGALERCAGEILARWGAPELVVPAAGVVSLAPVQQTTPEDF